MELFFSDEAAHLSERLPEFKTRPLAFTHTEGLPHRAIKSCVATDARSLDTYDLDFLFAYEVFPRSILKFFGEWQLENRAMCAGDVIVQQAQVPPAWGVYLVFGVRVLSVHREETQAGFSYGTLAGHPEIGTNEFSFSLVKGNVIAAVRTVAKPVLPLGLVLAPLFINRFIAFCNGQALRRMEQKFRQSNNVDAK